MKTMQYPIRLLVERSQRAGSSEVEPSDRIITPATLFSASRPVLALKAAEMLLHGKKRVGLVVAGMAATDMEGVVARLMDKWHPEWGLGTSKFGAKADIAADASSLLIVSGAALLAPRVSIPGKAAVGAVLAQEGVKTAWAAVSAAKHLRQTGELLDIPTDNEGKIAMVEKFIAIEAAVCTGDTDNPDARAAFGALALTFAGVGTLRGERVRRGYQEEFATLMEENYWNQQDAEAAGRL